MAGQDDDTNRKTGSEDFPLLTNQVLHTLREIQEPNGMCELYITLLDKLVELILVRGEDIGLDDSTSLSYIRILRMIRADILCLGVPSEEGKEEEPEFHPL